MDTNPAKPHLIHIGFPKCASTYLQAWFEAHPQIAYKPGGLGGLHSVFDLVEAVTGSGPDHRCRVTSTELLSCPRDPASFGSTDPASIGNLRLKAERACRELAALYPNAHILVVTRGVADVLRSSYSELVRNGAAVLWSEMEAYDRSAYGAVQGFDYDHCIACYRRHFGDRVLVLPHELLVDDRSAFLGAIEELMGLDRFEPGDERHNPSLSAEELYWYPRIARMLRKFPAASVRRRLDSLHRAMIRSGRWKPVLRLLRLLHGKRETRPHVSSDLLRYLSAGGARLAEEDRFEAYRELYRIP